MDRRRRRARTLAISLRRRTEHLARLHRDGRVDCACELSPFYFARRHAIWCRCRRVRRGRPRLASGPCRWSWRERLYAERRRWREEAIAIVTRGVRDDDAFRRTGWHRHG